MNKNSKIYVAGHEGMVGSALLRKLYASGYANILTRSFAQLDLRRQAEVEAFFAQERPEYVFLAAAKVGGILANNTYKAEFIYDNLMIASNVIHASYKNGVKKLLNLGSSCIYPKNAPQPLKEEYLLTGPLEPTNEPYAIAKIAAIKLCHYYNEQYGTSFISVMPTNLYGPNDNFNLETAHVLPALIRKFHLAKLYERCDFEAIKNDFLRHKIGFGFDATINLDDINALKAVLSHVGIGKGEITLWGSGSPFREFLYVDDVASACVFLMQKYGDVCIGECINVGTGSDIQLKNLAALVKTVIGFNGSIIFDAIRPDGTPKKLLDVAKINRLGWQASIDLAEGVTLFYDHYKDNSIKSYHEKGLYVS